MKTEIRYMEERDREQVLSMMREFYSSPAILTCGSEAIFRADFENCIGDNPFIEGYVFEDSSNILGYAMAAKSFSAEFGKPCIWIEDLYIKAKWRNMGMGSRFLSFIAEKYPDSLLRLEVEEDNMPALGLYKKSGFEVFPYTEMKKHT